MEKRTGYLKTELRAEETDLKKYIRGYFIVFNQMTQLYGDIWEEIAPEAVSDALDNVRALYNHNMDIVLGTTDNHTAILTKDAKGLFAEIEINEADPDAVGAHARVARGDIKGCSFGFYPTKEEHRSEDGKEIFRVTGMELLEISPCVFPAYPQTSIAARQKDLVDIKQRELMLRKKKLLSRLKGDK